MRKCILLALIAVACSRAPGPGGSLTGAPSPRQAAAEFMNAVKAGDLQALSAVWGTEQGPARDQLERTDLEQRLVILLGCYRHDNFSLGNERTGSGGERVIEVQIVRGNRSKTAAFQMVRGPSDRWYVRDADFNAVQEFCAG